MINEVEQKIINVDKNICNNIASIYTNRGFLSQNILSQLRNLVEAIAVKIYLDSVGKEQQRTEYDQIKQSIKYIKSKAKFSFLSKFHCFLQQSASHYTQDENNSERLMLKYYEFLIKVKNFLKEQYDMEILDNIDEFPLHTDTTSKEYYKKIAECIENKAESVSIQIDRYYIQKIKPFFINNKVYYEITYNVARNNTSKFDRLIAFTKIDIPSNYAVKLHIRSANIEILNQPTPIKIIEEYKISIRPCEIDNFILLIQKNIPKINTKSKEYEALMNFLTNSNYNLVDLSTMEEEDYEFLKGKIIDNNSSNFFSILDKCRMIIQNSQPGSNILRYLLYTLNNKIIKQQFSNEQNSKLSNLYLLNGSIPFDKMPFASSLVMHNPKISHLLHSLDYKNKEYEFLARFLKNETENNGRLFICKDDIEHFINIEQLVESYNNKLYHKHSNRKLEFYKKFIYTSGYLESTIAIIKHIQSLANTELNGCTECVKDWLKHNLNKIDCENKKEALNNIFNHSKVALVYGAAGTGKTTLLNYISQIFNDKNKLYLAHTNTAVYNLKQKIKAAKSEFATITKVIHGGISTQCDILFLDECSIISNTNMLEILKKTQFKLLILAGDILQIESIQFGNWFSMLKQYNSFKKSIIELKKPYRTNNDKLIMLWDRVRNKNDDILEHITNNGYSNDLDDSIFNLEPNSIVLALNYDGLYGINNINTILQNKNTNPVFHWGESIYKVEDPVLFNETKRFSSTLYNNLKGIIRKIHIDETDKNKKIYFTIEVDKIISEMDSCEKFELLETRENTSLIRFYVNEYPTTDEDNDDMDTQVPFQVSYAISIHKAQGLEYDCIKIIISDEIDEQITHNIFYTAITRAKENLKIYWSAEVEKKVLTSFIEQSSKQKIDINILKNFHKD